MNCPHCQALISDAPANLPKIKDTTDAAQEAAILAALREAGAKGLTTDDLRAAGHYQVSARIWALRNKWGAVINTELYNGVGADSVYHCRMARYRLVSEPLAPPTNTRKPRQSPPQERRAGGAACH